SIPRAFHRGGDGTPPSSRGVRRRADRSRARAATGRWEMAAREARPRRCRRRGGRGRRSKLSWMLPADGGPAPAHRTVADAEDEAFVGAAELEDGEALVFLRRAIALPAEGERPFAERGESLASIPFHRDPGVDEAAADPIPRMRDDP